MFHEILSRQDFSLLVDAWLLGNEVNSASDNATIISTLQYADPANTGLAISQAWQLIRLHKYAAARELLMTADLNAPGKAIIKALTAFCLMLQGDSLWQSYLDEAKALPPSDEADAIVHALGEFIQTCPPGVAGADLASLAGELN